MFDPKAFIYDKDGKHESYSSTSYIFFCEYREKPNIGAVCKTRPAVWGWDHNPPSSSKTFEHGYYLCAEHYTMLAGYTQDDAKLIEYAKELQHVRP